LNTEEQSDEATEVCSLCEGTGEIKVSIFGKKLRNDRHIMGISQRELAKECGITASTISFIEKGDVKPRKPTLVMINLVMDKFRKEKGL